MILQSMVNTTAVFRSEEEVRCPAYRGNLAISNDGATVSVAVRVVVYDSLCEVCDNTKCTLRVSSLSNIHCWYC